MLIHREWTDCSGRLTIYCQCSRVFLHEVVEIRLLWRHLTRFKVPINIRGPVITSYQLFGQNYHFRVPKCYKWYSRYLLLYLRQSLTKMLKRASVMERSLVNVLFNTRNDFIFPNIHVLFCLLYKNNSPIVPQK